MHTLTTNPIPSISEGDTVHFHRQPNSIRRRVDFVQSPTVFTIKEVRRPSRGFARHVRRAKALRIRGERR